MPATDIERSALDTLADDDRTPTARVFAVAREIEGRETSVQDVFVAFARWRARHHFTVPSGVEASLERLCTAARDQGHEVDAAAACAAAVPTDEGEVRTRARSIRDANAVGRERLDAFLDAAREAGYEVGEHELDRQTTTDPTPEANRADGDAAATGEEQLSAATLSRMVRQTGRNVVTGRGTTGE